MRPHDHSGGKLLGKRADSVRGLIGSRQVSGPVIDHPNPVCFAKAGYRALAIDLDQQGNLSAGLGVDLNKLNSTAHRLLINETPDIRAYLVEIRPQLHLLPNSIDIEADDLLEAKKVNRELLLRRQLKPILPDFDVVVIDTPPAMRAATVNALVVADSVIIPIDSSSFALLGMNQLLKTIAAIKVQKQQFKSHLGVALTYALQAMPEVKGSKSFMEAARWWRGHRSDAKWQPSGSLEIGIEPG